MKQKYVGICNWKQEKSWEDEYKMTTELILIVYYVMNIHDKYIEK